MKNFIIGFVVGVLLSSVGGYFYSRYANRAYIEEAKRLKVDYDALKAKTEAQEKESQAKIKAALETIATLQGNIDSLNFINAQLDEKVTTLENKTANLEERNKQLLSEVEPIINANPALYEYVHNLNLQIVNYKEEVFTLKAKVDNLETIADDQKKKFDAMVLIAARYKKDWENEKELRISCEKRLALADSRIMTLETRSKWGMVGTGAFLVTTVVLLLAK